jgi:hypothetical protein
MYVYISHLVNGAGDALEPVVLAVSRGDAHVGGVGPAGERVHARVHAALVIVEPDRTAPHIRKEKHMSEGRRRSPQIGPITRS